MAQLRNKITNNRLLVQLPSYSIKTRAIATSSLEQKHKNFYPHFFGKKMGKYRYFQRSVHLLTPMGLFQFICSVDF